MQSGHIKTIVSTRKSGDIGRLSSLAARVPPMPDASFQRAQQYCARLRRSAYEFVREDVIASGDVRVPLRLSSCDSDAIAAWRKTWTGPHPSGWGNWGLGAVAEPRMEGSCRVPPRNLERRRALRPGGSDVYPIETVLVVVTPYHCTTWKARTIRCIRSEERSSSWPSLPRMRMVATSVHGGCAWSTRFRV